MAEFTDLIDLAAERVGGAVLSCNDEFFASKDNLLKSAAAVWREGEYTDRGKWMDGWETRRRRTEGYDWCIVRLGLPGVIRGCVVDTAFFRGNFPESCAIEAYAVEGHPSPEQLASSETQWVEILPRAVLQGDSQNKFAIADHHRFTHLRLNIFPDGGVARLRVHGEVIPHPRALERDGAEADLASVENGARVVLASDMFFGNRNNLIMPGRGVNMGDGWETRRRRTPGHDWCVIQLAAIGTIHRIEVDTGHFRGNAPESCQIEVCYAPDQSIEPVLTQNDRWTEVLPRAKLQPHTRHWFDDDAVLAHTQATHVRFRIFPEGGVSRLRLFGTVSAEGRERVALRRINTLIEQDAIREFHACCASSRWTKAMSERRPFANSTALLEAAASVWHQLGPDDFREAFAGHPKIGEKSSHAPQSARSKRWAEQEQSRTSAASSETLAALAKANHDYEARFGYIYIVCATGKSADEMLAIAQKRLQNEPATEIRVAADEQEKITALRLKKWMGA